MDLLVCIKQVIDPEITLKDLDVHPDRRKDIVTLKARRREELVAQLQAPEVIGPYDSNALEEGLRLKERHGGKVTCITLGGRRSDEALRRAIALGVDEVLRVEDPGLTDYDVYNSAKILAEAIRRIGRYDLILFGAVSGDWALGQVGIGIAEMMGLPCSTYVEKIAYNSGRLVVDRSVDDGVETQEMPLPAVITVNNNINEPRMPSVRGRLKATAAKIPVMKIDRTSSTDEVLSLSNVVIPKRERACEFVAGETPGEKAVSLVKRLKELAVI